MANIQERTTKYGKAMAMIAKRALVESGVSKAQIARDSGLNVATLWRWMKVRTSPTPNSLRKLADGLDRRGGDLQTLAKELRKAAGERGA